MEVTTVMASVSNLCANAGSAYFDVWWQYDGPAADDLPVEYKVLLRETPQDADSKVGWKWQAAETAPTSDKPLRVAAPDLTPETDYQLCVRYEVAGQVFDSDKIAVQTKDAEDRWISNEVVPGRSTPRRRVETHGANKRW